MPALTGRALVAAMCLGQVGNLLPHVVVPAIMAQDLMPLWDLSAAQAGLMASAYARGPGAHRAHRPHRRASNIDRWLGLERSRDRVVWFVRGRSLVGDLDLGSCRDRVCRRLH